MRRYGITVHVDSEMTGFVNDRKEVRFASLADGTQTTLGYDVLHTVPPQSAPDSRSTGTRCATPATRTSSPSAT